MRRLSISQAWVETRTRLVRDGRLYVAVALALLVLPATIMGLIAPPAELTGREPPASAAWLGMLVAVIGLVGQLALVRLATGSGVSVGQAIAHGGRRFLPTFVALILFGLAMTLIAIPFMIAAVALGWVEASAGTPQISAPGPFGLIMLILIVLVLAISVRLMLMLPVSSVEQPGPVGILKRSWALTAGQYWRLLGFLVLIVIAALAILSVGGLIGGLVARLVSGPEVEPMSVGALLAGLIAALAQAAFTILSSTMLARIYVQLAGNDGGAEATVPPSAA